MRPKAYSSRFEEAIVFWRERKRGVQYKYHSLLRQEQNARGDVILYCYTLAPAFDNLLEI